MFIGRKQLYITERRLMISSSNKMQPLSVTDYSCWFLKKVRAIKNKLSLVTEVDEPKTWSLVKPRGWSNFIVKFQNLQQINCYHQSQPKGN